MEEIFVNLVRKGIVTKYYGGTLGNVGSMHSGKMKLRKQQTTKKGYKRVHLKINGESISELTHRIIAMCFLPNPHNYPQVNHINGKDKGNNCPSNLEWCDHQYNMTHAWETGLMNPAKGEKHSMTKFSDATIDRVHELRALGYSYREIGKKVSMSQSHVCNILSGKKRNRQENIS